MPNPSPEKISQPEHAAIVTTAAIIDQLKQATTDLLWSSESDYPFEIVTWEPGIELTPTDLFSNIYDTDLAIKSITLTDLLEPVLTIEDWYEQAELALVDQYTNLLDSINTNLSEVQVFRVGEVEIDIYIIGKTPTGDIIGLKTRSIET
ncbi:MAG: nuclease A inhibitor family protein [Chamaesiphon sp.]|nr:nuclease A inhibitor family protein [Chamaesiphon sp.]